MDANWDSLLTRARATKHTFFKQLKGTINGVLKLLQLFFGTFNIKKGFIYKFFGVIKGSKEVFSSAYTTIKRSELMN